MPCIAMSYSRLAIAGTQKAIMCLAFVAHHVIAGLVLFNYGLAAGALSQAFSSGY